MPLTPRSCGRPPGSCNRKKKEKKPEPLQRLSTTTAVSPVTAKGFGRSDGAHVTPALCLESPILQLAKHKHPKPTTLVEKVWVAVKPLRKVAEGSSTLLIEMENLRCNLRELARLKVPPLCPIKGGGGKGVGEGFW